MRCDLKTGIILTCLLTCQISESAFIKTLNQYGWMADELDPISEAFIDFSATRNYPVLDIGTAYGFTAEAALIRVFPETLV